MLMRKACGLSLLIMAINWKSMRICYYAMLHGCKKNIRNWYFPISSRIWREWLLRSQHVVRMRARVPRLYLYGALCLVDGSEGNSYPWEDIGKYCRGYC